MTIASRLRQLMIERDIENAWAGNPDLMLEAYQGRVRHPMDRIAAVIAAARRSPLVFRQAGYIRACDSTGRREILHPCFVLREREKIE